MSLEAGFEGLMTCVVSGWSLPHSCGSRYEWTLNILLQPSCQLLAACLCSSIMDCYPSGTKRQDKAFLL